MTKTKSKTASPPAARRPGQPSEREPGISLGIAALIYFGLALVYFLPAFLPDRFIFGTDYLAGGYFVYHFISARLAAGELPKWLPYLYGGVPHFANPGSTYHPVHFLADLLLPTGRVLPAVFLVHCWIAGVGMYLLARELGCRPWVAFVAGLAFQFTGITMSWIYAGHDGRFMVATVAPLFFFFLHRGVRTGGLAPFVGAAATLGAALLSFQIQNAYYLLLAGAIWAVFCVVLFGVARKPALLVRMVALGFAAVALGFTLAAVNFVPFQDYVGESPRGDEEGRGYEFSISFSMPPADLLGLAVPEQSGVSVSDPQTGQPLFPAYRGPNPMKLHTEYVGALVLVLVALGGYYSRRNRYWWFFLGLTVFAFSLALGGHTPLYRVYYEVLPGLKRFRAPDLAYYVAAFSLVVMAALTLERLAELRGAAAARVRDLREEGGLDKLVWIAGAVVALAVMGGLLVAAAGDGGPGEPSRSLGWWRFALFAALVGGVLWAWTRGQVATLGAVLALALITVADLWIINKRFFHTVPPPEQVFAPDDVMQFLRMRPEPNRMWTFPFPQAYRSGSPNGGNYPMLFGIEQAGGEHGNQLQRFNEYAGAGERVYVDWHNFVAEASVVETAAGQAIAFRGTPGFLEAANIRYIVSMAPLAHPALREVHRGSALVYEHTEALPRAYLVPEAVLVPEGGALAAMRTGGWDPRTTAFVEAGAALALPAARLEGSAQVVEHEPDRVVVRTRADRPALLVLADNYYDGWEATVSGEPAEVFRTNHTFRGVLVPEGEHEVRFVFRPAQLYLGLWITLAAIALLAGYGAFLLIRRWRTAEAAGAAE